MKKQNANPSSHIIPERDRDKHSESMDCYCQPYPIVDAETGTMIWIHNITKDSDFIKDMLKP